MLVFIAEVLTLTLKERFLMQEQVITTRPFDMIFHLKVMPEETYKFMEQDGSVLISESIMATVKPHDVKFSEHLRLSKKVYRTLSNDIDVKIDLGANLFTQLLIFEIMNIVQLNCDKLFDIKYEINNDFEWSTMGTFGDTSGGRFMIMHLVKYDKGITLAELVESISAIYVATNFLGYSGMKKVVANIFHGTKLMVEGKVINNG